MGGIFQLDIGEKKGYFDFVAFISIYNYHLSSHPPLYFSSGPPSLHHPLHHNLFCSSPTHPPPKK